MTKTQLLCTFVEKPKLQDLLNRIERNFEISYGKIFVLDTEEHGLVVSYNIEYDPNNKFLGDSILVHRKKETNTIYTINALNEMIKVQNNGQMDTSFQLDWGQLQNRIILTNHTGLVQIPTSIHKVIFLS